MGPIVRITRSQLKNIIREAQANVTKQYDDDSALKGNQSELPDGLQKAIIDKTVKDREEAEEEKQELLEYERHVDKDGNVYDDEGNVERRGSSFGRRYGGETYAGTSAPWDNKQNTPNVSSASSANTNLQKAIEISLASKPSNFLESILDQILAGKTLSNKQIVIVKKILVKQDPTTSNLFKENKMKVTKRQLRRIIKEEKAKMIREQPYSSPGGNLSAESLDNDMTDLIELIGRAEHMAAEIELKMQDVEYAENAGGREAEDLQAALAGVWDAFGVDSDVNY